jgi:hypothetical protein
MLPAGMPMRKRRQPAVLLDFASRSHIRDGAGN